MKYKHSGPFLVPGRIVRVEDEAGLDFGFAVVLNIRRTKKRDPESGSVLADAITADVLVRVAVENPDDYTKPVIIDPEPLEISAFKPIDDADIKAAEDEEQEREASFKVETKGGGKNRKRPSKIDGAPPAKKSKPSTPVAMATIASVSLECLHEMSAICLNFKAVHGADIRNSSALVGKFAKLSPSLRMKFWEGIERAKEKLNGEVPLLDPIKDLDIKSDALRRCLENIHLIKARMNENPLAKRSDVDQLVHSHERRIMVS